MADAQFVDPLFCFVLFTKIDAKLNQSVLHMSDDLLEHFQSSWNDWLRDPQWGLYLSDSPTLLWRHSVPQCTGYTVSWVTWLRFVLIEKSGMQKSDMSEYLVLCPPTNVANPHGRRQLGKMITFWIVPNQFREYGKSSEWLKIMHWKKFQTWNFPPPNKIQSYEVFPHFCCPYQLCQNIQMDPTHIHGYYFQFMGDLHKKRWNKLIEFRLSKTNYMIGVVEPPPSYNSRFKVKDGSWPSTGWHADCSLPTAHVTRQTTKTTTKPPWPRTTTTPQPRTTTTWKQQ